MARKNSGPKKAKRKSLFEVNRYKDPIGAAIEAFTAGNQKTGEPTSSQLNTSELEIYVTSDKIEPDIIPVKTLFRTLDEMPAIEKRALLACRGNLLDIGAAAGCHAKALQSMQCLDALVAIDTSPKAVKYLKTQGINAFEINFYQLDHQHQHQYDTLLLLMNGLGIAGTLRQLPQFFEKLKFLLKPDGQVLLDSSDFEEDAEDFAEIRYQMRFQNHKSKHFPWLFLPFDALHQAAENAGFHAQLLMKETDGSYLARLKLSDALPDV